MDAIDLLDHLWIATLALTASLVLVAMLRVPWRRAFGAEHACRLWWLVPLAVVTSQLPHAAATPVMVVVPKALAVVSNLPQAVGGNSGAGGWNAQTMLLAGWILGVIGCLALAAWRQWRYVRALRGAQRLPASHATPPVWRCEDTAAGPALVGVLRPRIVVPADFEIRYDAGQRALILMHESLHARRRDALGCAVGVMLHALFWFHPLAWWGLLRFRRDQELACDAGVMRQCPGRLREYATAMLQTQAVAQALPVGCPWFNHHPLKERIAMLKNPIPNRARRLAGLAAAPVLALVMAASVYASSQPARVAVDTYQVSMQLMRNGKAFASPSVCMKSGQPARISVTSDDGQPQWTFELTARPVGKDRVHVDVHGKLELAEGGMPMNAALDGALGKTASIVFKHEGSKSAPVTMKITPTPGCAAHPRLSAKMHGVPARSAARNVAAKAGFVLDNPEALSTRPVAFRFDDMPSANALQLIAKVDGKRAVFDGKHVRFESP